MRLLLSLLFAATLSVSLHSQIGSTLYHSDRVENRNTVTTIIPEWAPFYHGVASGDPLSDRVIIWTRVTPEEMDNAPIEVSWKVATDVDLENIVQSGTFTTDATRDYTVKVDVTGLEAGTTYYYGFTAMDKNSLTGKTKTTPTGDQADHLKFGVVSCSNYQAGYFNAYQRLARRNDLDAVIHLGDYIYEYGDGVYGDSTLFEARDLDPDTEILTLEDYRTRYSLYRLDTSLVRAHQQHPFISVWDDHESANDAYMDGAQNHTEGAEGSWEDRKAISKQVYFEWMPIRDNAEQSVYRNISYGNLMDLIMLDTRLEGREEQIADINSPEFNDPDRTLLGAEQKAWLLDQLSNSTAQWKVLGQQIIFSELHVGWAALIDPNQTYAQAEGLFTDIWDGYPAERSQIISFIDTNNIDNTVILTGDFHSTFAYDVADMPVTVTFQDFPFVGEAPVYVANDNYDAATGAGSIAVEFACPSVTSANFDENIDAGQAATFQNVLNNPFEPFPGINLGTANPHMKYVDLIQHGYFILDVKPDSTQADWFFTPINEPTEVEAFGQGWYTLNSENHLNQAAAPAGPKAVQDEPAPDDPPAATPMWRLLMLLPLPFWVFTPILQMIPIPYTIRSQKRHSVNIGLYDQAGKRLRTLVDAPMPAGLYTLQNDVKDLPNGTYIYRIQVGEQLVTAKLVVGR
jgi:alkaline phosphatase D